MDGELHQPDSKISRFMALTGCDLQRATFCLEAANFDIQAATGMYSRDVARQEFQNQPPSQEEQHRVLETGPSLMAIAGIVSGVAALGYVDGFFLQVLKCG